MYLYHCLWEYLNHLLGILLSAIDGNLFFFKGELEPFFREHHLYLVWIFLGVSGSTFGVFMSSSLRSLEMQRLPIFIDASLIISPHFGW